MHGTNVTALHTNVTALHYERPNNDNENTKFIKLFLQLDTDGRFRNISYLGLKRIGQSSSLHSKKVFGWGVQIFGE